MPFESRTRAILRSAEFGFFGVIVRTTVQTPRFWGAPFGRTEWRPLSEFHVRRRAGVSTFLRWGFRPLRISCEVVGTCSLLLLATSGYVWAMPDEQPRHGMAVPRLPSSGLPPFRDAAPRGVRSRAQRDRTHKIARGPMREMTARKGHHRPKERRPQSMKDQRKRVNRTGTITARPSIGFCRPNRQWSRPPGTPKGARPGWPLSKNFGAWR